MLKFLNFVNCSKSTPMQVTLQSMVSSCNMGTQLPLKVKNFSEPNSGGHQLMKMSCTLMLINCSKKIQHYFETYKTKVFTNNVSLKYFET